MSPSDSERKPAAGGSPRAPRAFRLDDPALDAAPPPPPEPPTTADTEASADAPARPATTTTGDGGPGFAAGAARGFRWGALLLSALTALASLAIGVWYARLVSVALMRDDWVGWTATALLAAAGVALLVLLGRELVGLSRLARLKDLRRDVDAALASRDAKTEARAVKRLKALFAARPEMKWPLARLAEHEADVRDAGDLLALADREIVAPLDTAARRLILRSAKRVATVTAMSPFALLTVGFVAVENLSLLRGIAGLYGGRPGGVGALRLARMVFTHILATGGIALTDDMLGQFIGQDLMRRLSRRLGEGAFNGALTARVGAATVEVCRPLPNVASSPVRARDIVAELFKKDAAAKSP